MARERGESVGGERGRCTLPLAMLGGSGACAGDVSRGQKRRERTWRSVHGERPVAPTALSTSHLDASAGQRKEQPVGPPKVVLIEAIDSSVW